MKSIELTNELRKHIPDLNEEIAIRDQSGKIVAYVVPPGHRELLYSLVNKSMSELPPETVHDRQHHQETLAELRRELAKVRA